ncbi:MAG: peptidoglycan-binding protein [Propionibacteriaceae bacterium]|jgi:hypothetical protein|nr:peptidoglycan-binding protein [Propionibacteriaceae bacterium]
MAERRPGHSTRDRQSTGQSPLSPAVLGLAGVVLVALGALAAACWLPTPTPTLLQPPPGPVTAAVAAEWYDGGRDVSAEAVAAPGRALVAPTAGVVTASACRQGETIASGAAPWTIGDQPILALATATPLWRDLESGAQGADVAALQVELARLGQPLEASGRYDWATAQAVAALWRAVQVTDRDDLPLAAVLWLPTDQATVAACAAQLGDVVAPGQELAQLSGQLLGLSLANPPGADGWVVRLGEATAAVTAAGRVEDPVFLAALAADPTWAAARAAGMTSLSLRLELAQPLSVLVVPASAIIPTSANTGCVVSEGRALAVTIVASSLGQTMVAPTGGDEPSQVEVRPDPGTHCP